MDKIYRLVYASKANIKLGNTGINPEVSRILLKSKNNNTKLEIGGVLYYADGYFFQVLEGDKTAVSNLYNTITTDSRHSDVTVLLEGTIDQSQFSKWSMHFVATNSSIRQLLEDYNFKLFKPFDMSPLLIENMITVLSNNGIYQRTVTNKQSVIQNIINFFRKNKTI